MKIKKKEIDKRRQKKRKETLIPTKPTRPHEVCHKKNRKKNVYTRLRGNIRPKHTHRHTYTFTHTQTHTHT